MEPKTTDPTKEAIRAVCLAGILAHVIWFLWVPSYHLKLRHPDEAAWVQMWLLVPTPVGMLVGIYGGIRPRFAALYAFLAISIVCLFIGLGFHPH